MKGTITALSLDLRMKTSPKMEMLGTDSGESRRKNGILCVRPQRSGCSESLLTTCISVITTCVW